MSNRNQEIRTFIIDTFLFGEAEGLTDDTSFLDWGVIDSTGVLELVTHLEQAYEIRVDGTEMIPENLDSVNAVAAFLERKIGAAECASPDATFTGNPGQ